MRIFRSVVLRILVAVLFVGSMLPMLGTGKAAGDGGAIVADHKVVDQYDDIPQEWIDKVKKMYLNVPGESHSTGYLIGLDLLSQWNPNYPAIVIDSGEPTPYTDQALRMDRFVYTDDNRRTGEGVWYTWHAWPDYDDPDCLAAANATMIMNHITYCHDSGFEISAIGFGWCWDMSYRYPPGGDYDTIDGVQFRWAGASEGGPDVGEYAEYGLRWGLDDEDYEITGNHVNMDDYLEATEEYISYASAYDTKVFFTTGPVDRGTDFDAESGYQREIKQKYIRDYVIAHNRALFDYADILTYSDNDPDNQYKCSWDGHDFPQIHPDNTMDYDEDWTPIPHEEVPPYDDGDHIGQVGAVRVAKAMWWMLARMAGWDGTPATQDDTEIPSVTVGSPDGGEKYKAGCLYDITWTATDNVSVTSCNISYSTDNGASYIDIATGEANDGIYTWTIPDNPSTTCLVKVAAVDPSGNWGYDESDAVFEICDSIPGDANDDGCVDSLDITRTELIILEQVSAPPLPHDADANGDLAINVLDITRIEQIINGS